jgi:molybdopterin molybdotransferase
MISVEQAVELVLQHTGKLQRCRRISVESALGCVLAEEITSDIDSPPHDKSQVDGFAICDADLQNDQPLQVIERIMAGQVPAKPLVAGTTIQIMTGAPIPENCAAMVMVEKTEEVGTDQIRILDRGVKSGMNIMRRASSMKKDELVLAPGTVLRGIELGLLAEVGRENVWAFLEPAVAILPTGDEIVPYNERPPAGKIRNSNGVLLTNLVLQAGGSPLENEIVPDEAETLLAAIAANLESDVILLSGGVSAGVHDLVPAALAKAGVMQVFHHVNLKPGKPLWFGFYDRGGDQPPCLVFGLPGNPVSGLVCFELFVRPALQKMRGQEPRGLARWQAALATEHTHRGDRPAYWPAVLSADESSVTPLRWQGSGDLRTLARANALAHFPGGNQVWGAGEEVRVYRLPSMS